MEDMEQSDADSSSEESENESPSSEGETEDCFMIDLKFLKLLLEKSKLDDEEGKLIGLANLMNRRERLTPDLADRLSSVLKRLRQSARSQDLKSSSIHSSEGARNWENLDTSSTDITSTEEQFASTAEKFRAPPKGLVSPNIVCTIDNAVCNVSRESEVSSVCETADSNFSYAKDIDSGDSLLNQRHQHPLSEDVILRNLETIYKVQEENRNMNKCGHFNDDVLDLDFDGSRRRLNQFLRSHNDEGAYVGRENSPYKQRREKRRKHKNRHRHRRNKHKGTRKHRSKSRAKFHKKSDRDSTVHENLEGSDKSEREDPKNEKPIGNHHKHEESDKDLSGEKSSRNDVLTKVKLSKGHKRISDEVEPRFNAYDPPWACREKKQGEITEDDMVAISQLSPPHYINGAESGTPTKRDEGPITDFRGGVYHFTGTPLYSPYYVGNYSVSSCSFQAPLVYPPHFVPPLPIPHPTEAASFHLFHGSYNDDTYNTSVYEHRSAAYNSVNNEMIDGICNQMRDGTLPPIDFDVVAAAVQTINNSTNSNSNDSLHPARTSVLHHNLIPCLPSVKEQNSSDINVTNIAVSETNGGNEVGKSEGFTEMDLNKDDKLQDMKSVKGMADELKAASAPVRQKPVVSCLKQGTLLDLNSSPITKNSIHVESILHSGPSRDPRLRPKGLKVNEENSGSHNADVAENVLSCEINHMVNEEGRFSTPVHRRTSPQSTYPDAIAHMRNGLITEPSAAGVQSIVSRSKEHNGVSGVLYSRSLPKSSTSLQRRTSGEDNIRTCSGHSQDNGNGTRLPLLGIDGINRSHPVYFNTSSNNELKKPYPWSKESTNYDKRLQFNSNHGSKTEIKALIEVDVSVKMNSKFSQEQSNMPFHSTRKASPVITHTNQQVPQVGWSSNDEQKSSANGESSRSTTRSPVRSKCQQQPPFWNRNINNYSQSQDKRSLINSSTERRSLSSFSRDSVDVRKEHQSRSYFRESSMNIREHPSQSRFGSDVNSRSRSKEPQVKSLQAQLTGVQSGSDEYRSRSTYRCSKSPQRYIPHNKLNGCSSPNEIRAEHRSRSMIRRGDLYSRAASQTSRRMQSNETRAKSNPRSLLRTKQPASRVQSPPPRLSRSRNPSRSRINSRSVSCYRYLHHEQRSSSPVRKVDHELRFGSHVSARKLVKDSNSKELSTVKDTKSKNDFSCLNEERNSAAPVKIGVISSATADRLCRKSQNVKVDFKNYKIPKRKCEQAKIPQSDNTADDNSSDSNKLPATVVQQYSKFREDKCSVARKSEVSKKERRQEIPSKSIDNVSDSDYFEDDGVTAKKRRRIINVDDSDDECIDKIMSAISDSTNDSDIQNRKRGEKMRTRRTERTTQKYFAKENEAKTKGRVIENSLQRECVQDKIKNDKSVFSKDKKKQDDDKTEITGGESAGVNEMNIERDEEEVSHHTDKSEIAECNTKNASVSSKRRRSTSISKTFTDIGYREREDSCREEMVQARNKVNKKTKCRGEKSSENEAMQNDCKINSMSKKNSTLDNKNTDITNTGVEKYVLEKVSVTAKNKLTETPEDILNHQHCVAENELNVNDISSSSKESKGSVTSELIQQLNNNSSGDVVDKDLTAKQEIAKSGNSTEEPGIGLSSILLTYFKSKHHSPDVANVFMKLTDLKEEEIVQKLKKALSNETEEICGTHTSVPDAVSDNDQCNSISSKAALLDSVKSTVSQVSGLVDYASTMDDTVCEMKDGICRRARKRKRKGNYGKKPRKQAVEKYGNGIAGGNKTKPEKATKQSVHVNRELDRLHRDIEKMSDTKTSIFTVGNVRSCRKRREEEEEKLQAEKASARARSRSRARARSRSRARSSKRNSNDIMQEFTNLDEKKSTTSLHNHPSCSYYIENVQHRYVSFDKSVSGCETDLDSDCDNNTEWVSDENTTGTVCGVKRVEPLRIKVCPQWNKMQSHSKSRKSKKPNTHASELENHIPTSVGIEDPINIPTSVGTEDPIKSTTTGSVNIKPCPRSVKLKLMKKLNLFSKELEEPVSSRYGMDSEDESSVEEREVDLIPKIVLSSADIQTSKMSKAHNTFHTIENIKVSNYTSPEGDTSNHKELPRCVKKKRKQNEQFGTLDTIIKVEKDDYKDLIPEEVIDDFIQRMEKEHASERNIDEVENQSLEQGEKRNEETIGVEVSSVSGGDVQILEHLKEGSATTKVEGIPTENGGTVCVSAPQISTPTTSTLSVEKQVYPTVIAAKASSISQMTVSPVPTAISAVSVQGSSCVESQVLSVAPVSKTVNVPKTPTVVSVSSLQEFSTSTTRESHCTQAPYIAAVSKPVNIPNAPTIVSVKSMQHSSAICMKKPHINLQESSSMLQNSQSGTKQAPVECTNSIGQFLTTSAGALQREVKQRSTCTAITPPEALSVPPDLPSTSNGNINLLPNMALHKCTKQITKLQSTAAAVISQTPTTLSSKITSRELQLEGASSVFAAVGLLRVFKKMGTYYYVCSGNLCLFSTWDRGSMHTHLINVHSSEMWDGFCSTCGTNVHSKAQMSSVVFHFMLKHFTLKCASGAKSVTSASVPGNITRPIQSSANSNIITASAVSDNHTQSKPKLTVRRFVGDALSGGEGIAPPNLMSVARAAPQNMSDSSASTIAEHIVPKSSDVSEKRNDISENALHESSHVSENSDHLNKNFAESGNVPEPTITTSTSNLNQLNKNFAESGNVPKPTITTPTSNSNYLNKNFAESGNVPEPTITRTSNNAPTFEKFIKPNKSRESIVRQPSPKLRPTKDLLCMKLSITSFKGRYSVKISEDSEPKGKGSGNELPVCDSGSSYASVTNFSDKPADSVVESQNKESHSEISTLTDKSDSSNAPITSQDQNLDSYLYSNLHDSARLESEFDKRCAIDDTSSAPVVTEVPEMEVQSQVKESQESTSESQVKESQKSTSELGCAHEAKPSDDSSSPASVRISDSPSGEYSLIVDSSDKHSCNEEGIIEESSLIVNCSDEHSSHEEELECSDQLLINDESAVNEGTCTLKDGDSQTDSVTAEECDAENTPEKCASKNGDIKEEQIKNKNVTDSGKQDNKTETKKVKLKMPRRPRKYKDPSLIHRSALVNLFKCSADDCYFTTPQSALFVKHVKQHSVERNDAEPDRKDYLCCIYCNQLCDSAEHLLNHITVVHEHCYYQCAYCCCYRACRPCYVSWHQTIHHDAEPIRILVADDETLRKAIPGTLMSSECFSKLILPYRCSKCPESCLTIEGFKEHFRTHKRLCNLTCYICLAKVNIANLHSHMKVHNVDIYQCMYCRRSCSDDQVMMKHLFNMHYNRWPRAIRRLHPSDEQATSPEWQVPDPVTKEVLEVVNFDLQFSTKFIDVIKNSSQTNEEEWNADVSQGATVIQGSAEEQAVVKDPSESNLEATEEMVSAISSILQSDPSAEESQENVDTRDVPDEDSGDKNCTDSNDTSDVDMLLVFPERPDLNITLQSLEENKNKADITSKKPSEPTYETMECTTEEIPTTSANDVQVVGVVGSKLYSCGLKGCNAAFSTFTPLKNHVYRCEYNYSVLSTFVCKHCKKSFMLPERYLEHLETHNVPRFLCSLCDRREPLQIQLMSHIKSFHRIYNPNIVPVLWSKNQKDRDMFVFLPESIESRSVIPGNGCFPRYIPESIRFLCSVPKCSYSAISAVMLKSHCVATHPKMNTFKCPHCIPTIADSQRIPLEKLESHFQLHAEKLYKCRYCEYFTHRRYCVIKHSKIKHPVSESTVEIIREFTENETMESVAADMNEDNEPKRWQCNFCKYAFSCEEKVRLHCRSVHCAESRYKCCYCKFTPDTKDPFNEHFMSCHPDMTCSVVTSYFEINILGSNSDRLSEDKTLTDYSPDKNRVILKRPPKSKRSIARKSTSRGRKRIKLDHSNSRELESNPQVLDNNLVIPSESNDSGTDLNQQDNNFDMETTNSGSCAITDENSETKIQKEPPFDLPTVPSDIENDSALKEAYVTPYPGGYYRCPKRGCKFKGKVEKWFEEHLYREYNYSRFVCKVCGRVGKTKGVLIEHAKQQHGSCDAIVTITTNESFEKWVKNLLEYQTCMIKTMNVTRPVEVQRRSPRIKNTYTQAVDQIYEFVDVDEENQSGVGNSRVDEEHPANIDILCKEATILLPRLECI